MYTVYVIKSLVKEWIYVGMTNNLKKRLDDHNKGYNKSTKPYSPSELLYTEMCESTLVAREREKYWKSGIGKQKIKEKYKKDSVGLPDGR